MIYKHALLLILTVILQSPLYSQSEGNYSFRIHEDWDMLTCSDVEYSLNFNNDNGTFSIIKKHDCSTEITPVFTGKFQIRQKPGESFTVTLVFNDFSASYHLKPEFNEKCSAPGDSLTKKERNYICNRNIYTKKADNPGSRPDLKGGYYLLKPALIADTVLTTKIYKNEPYYIQDLKKHCFVKR